MRRGQSLIEILVAVAVGAVMVLGAVAALTPSLKSNTDVMRAQTGAGLANEILNSIRAIAASDWHVIEGLTPVTTKYYVVASTSPFAVLSGTENVAVGSTTYTRYFVLNQVGRDAGGKIVSSGGTNDPSTRQIIVYYKWPNTATTSLAAYIIRPWNKTLTQTDWVGGTNQSGPLLSPNNKFASSTSLNTTTTPGSMFISF